MIVVLEKMNVHSNEDKKILKNFEKRYLKGKIFKAQKIIEKSNIFLNNTFWNDDYFLWI